MIKGILWEILNQGFKMEELQKQLQKEKAKSMKDRIPFRIANLEARIEYLNKKK